MKVTTIGESASGKTSILLRFVDDVFHDDKNCTIGVDVMTKVVQLDNR